MTKYNFTDKNNDIDVNYIAGEDQSIYQILSEIGQLAMKYCYRQDDFDNDEYACCDFIGILTNLQTGEQVKVRISGQMNIDFNASGYVVQD